MFLLELLVLAVIAIFAANGMRAGTIEGLGRVVGAILGFLAAKAWAGWLIVALALFMPVNWAFLVAFLIIFMIVDTVVGHIFKIVDKMFEIITNLPVIKQIDHIIGIIFGILEGIVVIGGIAYLFRTAAVASGFAASFISLKTVIAIEWIFTHLLGFLL